MICFGDTLMFDCCDDDLGSRDLVQHKFILHYDVPIAEPYRRIPPYHLQETCFHTEDLASSKSALLSVLPQLQ
ncbi:hypothetical protein RRG08_018595 [Elysia crispata]|uniref:Uncharacterized protein n=1 Tax=Elysia crispata TaxID=231223 RepID=A0AAE1DYK6_9GAST|nr:hypothetical protein RRG08_018595 [Elysia crispata]